MCKPDRRPCRLRGVPLGRVAEWQTRTVQVRVSVRTWGFNSPLAHLVRCVRTFPLSFPTLGGDPPDPHGAVGFDPAWVRSSLVSVSGDLALVFGDLGAP